MPPEDAIQTVSVSRLTIAGPCPIDAYRVQLPVPEIDLVCLRTIDIAPPIRADPHPLGLPAADLERWTKYRLQVDRDAFLAKRLLIRGALSQHASTLPADWQFIDNEYGKPSIANEGNVEALHFNLSSTPQLAVCAISRRGPVGVDVEDDTRCNALELVDWILGPEEKHRLSCLPLPEQPSAFLRYWTLKEAYVKARGIGVSLPLAEIQFDYNQKSGISVGFGDALHDDPARWQFLQFRLFNQFIVAVAIESEEMPPRY